MVDTQASFKAQASFDDAVRIESRVARLGRPSFDIARRLLRGETLRVEARETRVWAAASDEAHSLRVLQIPADLSERMAAD